MDAFDMDMKIVKNQNSLKQEKNFWKIKLLTISNEIKPIFKN